MVNKRHNVNFFQILKKNHYILHFLKFSLYLPDILPIQYQLKYAIWSTSIIPCTGVLSVCDCCFVLRKMQCIIPLCMVLRRYSLMPYWQSACDQNIAKLIMSDTDKLNMFGQTLTLNQTTKP